MAVDPSAGDGVPPLSTILDVLLSGPSVCETGPSVADHLARWLVSVQKLLVLHPRLVDLLIDAGLLSSLIEAQSSPAWLATAAPAQAAAWMHLTRLLASRCCPEDALDAALTPLRNALVGSEPPLAAHRAQMSATRLVALQASLLQQPAVPSCLDLSGPGCGLHVPEIAAWPADGLTVALWLKLHQQAVPGGARGQPESPPPSGAGRARRGETLLWRFESEALQGVEAVLGAKGHVIVRSRTDREEELCTTNSLQPGVWLHLVVAMQPSTFLRTGTTTIYVNGGDVISGYLPYPKSKSMLPPLRHSFVGGWHGQLTTAMAFSGRLSKSKVAALQAALPAPSIVPKSPARLSSSFHCVTVGKVAGPVAASRAGGGAGSLDSAAPCLPPSHLHDLNSSVTARCGGSGGVFMTNAVPAPMRAGQGRLPQELYSQLIFALHPSAACLDPDNPCIVGVPSNRTSWSSPLPALPGAVAGEVSTALPAGAAGQRHSSIVTPGPGPRGATWPRSTAPVVLMDQSTRNCHGVLVGVVRHPDPHDTPSAQQGAGATPSSPFDADAALRTALTRGMSPEFGLGCSGAGGSVLLRRGSVLHALRRAGGPALFFPILAAAAQAGSPKTAPVLPSLVDAACHSPVLTASAVGCIAAACSASIEQCRLFLHRGGIAALACLLKQLPPSHLTVRLLEHVSLLVSSLAGTVCTGFNAPEPGSPQLASLLHKAAAAAARHLPQARLLVRGKLPFGPAVAAAAQVELLFAWDVWGRAASTAARRHASLTMLLHTMLNGPSVAASVPLNHFLVVTGGGMSDDVKADAFTHACMFACARCLVLLHLGGWGHALQREPMPFATCPPLHCEGDLTDAFFRTQLVACLSQQGVPLPPAALGTTLGCMLTACWEPHRSEGQRGLMLQAVLGLLPAPLSAVPLLQAGVSARSEGDAEAPWSFLEHAESTRLPARLREASQLLSLAPAANTVDARLLEFLQRSGHCAAIWAALQTAKELPVIVLALRVLARYGFWQSHLPDAAAEVQMHYVAGHASMLENALTEVPITFSVYRCCMALLLGLDFSHVVQPSFEAAASSTDSPPCSLPAVLASQPIRHPALIPVCLQILCRAPLWVQLAGLRDWFALLCGDGHDALDGAPLISMGLICRSNRARMMQHARWPLLLAEICFTTQAAAQVQDARAGQELQGHAGFLQACSAGDCPAWVQDSLSTLNQTIDILKQRLLDPDTEQDVKVVSISSAASLRDLPFEHDAARAGASEHPSTPVNLAGLRFFATWKVGQLLLDLLRSPDMSLQLHAAVQDAAVTKWPELWGTLAFGLATQLTAALGLTDALGAQQDGVPPRGFAQLHAMLWPANKDQASEAYDADSISSLLTQVTGTLAKRMGGCRQLWRHSASSRLGIWQDILQFSLRHVFTAACLPSHAPVAPRDAAWSTTLRLVALASHGLDSCPPETAPGCATLRISGLVSLEQGRREVHAAAAMALSRLLSNVQSAVEIGLPHDDAADALPTIRAWLITDRSASSDSAAGSEPSPSSSASLPASEHMRHDSHRLPHRGAVLRYGAAQLSTPAAASLSSSKPPSSRSRSRSMPGKRCRPGSDRLEPAAVQAGLRLPLVALAAHFSSEAIQGRAFAGPSCLADRVRDLVRCLTFCRSAPVQAESETLESAATSAPYSLVSADVMAAALDGAFPEAADNYLLSFWLVRLSALRAALHLLESESIPPNFSELLRQLQPGSLTLNVEPKEHEPCDVTGAASELRVQLASLAHAQPTESALAASLVQCAACLVRSDAFHSGRLERLRADASYESAAKETLVTYGMLPFLLLPSDEQRARQYRAEAVATRAARQRGLKAAVQLLLWACDTPFWTPAAHPTIPGCLQQGAPVCSVSGGARETHPTFGWVVSAPTTNGGGEAGTFWPTLLDLRTTGVGTIGMPEVLYSVRCHWVTTMARVEGTLELSAAGLTLRPENLIRSDGSVVGRTDVEEAFSHEAITKVAWKPNDDHHHCSICEEEFVGTLVSTGKHHCRCCGSVVCNSCSTQRLALPSHGHLLPVRVCDSCVAAEMQGRMSRATQSSFARETAVGDEAAAGAARGGGCSPSTPSTTRISEDVDLLRNLLMKPHAWPIQAVQAIFSRRFLLRRTALEIVFSRAASGSMPSVASTPPAASGMCASVLANEAPGVHGGWCTEAFAGFLPHVATARHSQHTASTSAPWSHSHVAFAGQPADIGVHLPALFLVLRSEAAARELHAKLRQLQAANAQFAPVLYQSPHSGALAAGMFPAARVDPAVLSSAGVAVTGSGAVLPAGSVVTFSPGGLAQLQPGHGSSHGSGYPMPLPPSKGILEPVATLLPSAGKSRASAASFKFDPYDGGVPGDGSRAPLPLQHGRHDETRQMSPLAVMSDTQPEALAKLLPATQAWRCRLLSNLDYLLLLNSVAGRSTTDWSQYPIMPWVLADFSSESLNLEDGGRLPDGSPDLPGARPGTVWRDLSKPVGALNPARLQRLRADMEVTYEDTPPIPHLKDMEPARGGLSLAALRSLLAGARKSREVADSPDVMGPAPYANLHRGHYSNAVVPVFFFIRQEPFTTAALALQAGRFDHAERLFKSVPAVWESVLQDDMDIKELTPEWYTQLDGGFLRNSGRLNLGTTQSGEVVDHVALPPWADSPAHFIATHRAALESDEVSAHLHEWIDLIFGVKQRGEQAALADNLFKHSTYEGGLGVDLTALDAVQRLGLEMTILNFGQTPPTLFGDAHPKRLSAEDAVHFSATAAISSSLTMLRTTPVRVKIRGVPDSPPIVFLAPLPAHDALLSIAANGEAAVHVFRPAADASTGDVFTFREAPAHRQSRESPNALPGLASMYALHTSTCALSGAGWEDCSVTTALPRHMVQASASGLGTSATLAVFVGGPSVALARRHGLGFRGAAPVSPLASAVCVLPSARVLLRGTAPLCDVEVCRLLPHASGAGQPHGFLESVVVHHRLTWHEAPVTVVTHSEDGCLVLTADSSGGMALWRVSVAAGGMDDGHGTLAAALHTFGTEGVGQALAELQPQAQAGHQVSEAGMFWSASTAALAGDCTALSLGASMASDVEASDSHPPILLAGTSPQQVRRGQVGALAELVTPTVMPLLDIGTDFVDLPVLVQGLLMGALAWHNILPCISAVEGASPRDRRWLQHLLEPLGGSTSVSPASLGATMPSAGGTALQTSPVKPPRLGVVPTATDVAGQLAHFLASLRNTPPNVLQAETPTRHLVRCSASAVEGPQSSLEPQRAGVGLPPAVQWTPPILGSMPSVGLPTHEHQTKAAVVNTDAFIGAGALPDTSFSATVRGNIVPSMAEVGAAAQRAAAPAALGPGPATLGKKRRLAHAVAPTAVLAGHASPVVAACLSASIHAALSAGADGLILCHDCRTGRVRWRFHLALHDTEEQLPRSIAVLSTGVAVVVHGRRAVALGLNGDLAAAHVGKQPIVAAIALPRPRSKAHVLFVTERSICIWSVSDCFTREVDVQASSVSPIVSASLSSCGRALFCGMRDGQIACYALPDIL